MEEERKGERKRDRLRHTHHTWNPQHCRCNSHSTNRRRCAAVSKSIRPFKQYPIMDYCMKKRNDETIRKTDSILAPPPTIISIYIINTHP